MKSINTILLILCVTLLSCDVGDEDINTNQQVCINAPDVIIDASRYGNLNENVSITGLSLSGDCLTIIISGSGCDGSSWTLDLVDSDVVSFSSPPERNLILEFTNTELCTAVFEKSFTFDISSLQVSGNELRLNFNNSNTSLTTINYMY
ncbi:hypothetical protein JCM19298_2774 [Nonlabens ulvanivorans]|nr:hypothetical protein [Nonlabens ulvanivorans]GAK92286.1 hypothetical protein JCM19298_2774 [Nonlabens ulvanivorans]